jgi:4-azaleucine resistance transporter AzlC
MRSLYRTLGSRLVRDIALVCCADAVVGLSYGAISVSSGFPAWAPVLASLVVFAGAAQFLVVGVVAAGGSVAAAVVAGLLVNVRHVVFGLTLANTVGTGRLQRLVGSHLMIDESVAFALAQADPARRRAAYWACGVGLFAAWNLAVAAGTLVGRAVHDTDAWGLDAAFPAVLLALVLPALRTAATARAALVGAAIALVTAPLLPPGLPVLSALLGMVARGRGAAAGRASNGGAR